MQQFDLFLDSNDVRLRNDAAEAVRQRDAPALRRAIERLRSDFPGDCSLADLETLLAGLAFLETAPDSALDIADQINHIETVLLPPLRRIAGAGPAEDWIAKEFARLAAAAAFPFHRPLAHAHAASLFLRAGDPGAAKAAAEGIPSWRNIPEPLAWMAEIALREGIQDTYLPLLAELAWIAPALVDPLMRRAAPASVLRLFEHFLREADADGEAHEACWFPAWLLTEQSGLTHSLRAARANDSRPARCFALLVDLLTGERHGLSQIILDKRAQLRQLSRPLFARYMAQR